MYGQLGDIVFENLFGPSQEQESFGKVIARHPKINGRDKLQSTGIKLREIKITIRFNAVFCNPQEQLDKLKNYSEKGTILNYIKGDGTIVGNFVIESGTNNITKTFNNGAIHSCTMSLDLIENYIQDKKTQKKNQARINGTAVNVLQPVETNYNPPLINNPSLDVMTENKNLNESVSNIEKEIKKARNLFDYAQTASGKVTQAVNKIQAGITTVQGKISQAQALQDLIQQYPARLDSLAQSVQNLQALLPITSAEGLSQAYQASIIVKNDMSFANFAAAPAAAFAGYRGTF